MSRRCGRAQVAGAGQEPIGLVEQGDAGQHRHVLAEAGVGGGLAAPAPRRRPCRAGRRAPAKRRAPSPPRRRRPGRLAYRLPQLRRRSAAAAAGRKPLAGRGERIVHGGGQPAARSAGRTQPKRDHPPAPSARRPGPSVRRPRPCRSCPTPLAGATTDHIAPETARRLSLLTHGTFRRKPAQNPQDLRQHEDAGRRSRRPSGGLAASGLRPRPRRSGVRLSVGKRPLKGARCLACCRRWSARRWGSVSEASAARCSSSICSAVTVI